MPARSSVFSALPLRRGHFRLESGLHTDAWLVLDALFACPRDLAPLVADLADRLRPYRVSTVCGPLLGGAFLAQALATALDAGFCFSERVREDSPGLYGARYRIPSTLQPRLSGERVALVDDAISAGSSVRATATALTTCGASIVVVGTLLLLGNVARDHFAGFGLPVEALEQQELGLWTPAECPLCRSGEPCSEP